MTIFKPRTATLPLYGGDYQQRVYDLEQQLDAAEERAKKAQDGPRLLSEESEVERLTREHDELVAEAERDGRIVVTVQALRREQWNDLVQAHPPRTDESVPEDRRKGDEAVGVNEDTFAPALLSFDRDGRATIVDTGDPDLSVAELLREISDVQFQMLYALAFSVNRSLGSAPKARSGNSLPSPSGTATEN
jgi:hypothetical protein